MFSARWGSAERAVSAALEEAASLRVAERILDRDVSLWSPDVDVQHKIANRLGWLEAPTWAVNHYSALRKFGVQVRRASHDVLLGMGGSSLAPEVLARTFGAERLQVLDSTDPSELLAAERRIDFKKSLFFVASKSGETIETRSHAAYFFERVGNGSRFVAITDPGSPLEKLATHRGFKRVFLNPPNVGGRYSALTYFGLVPAAASGIDARPLLERAGRAAIDDAVALGVALAELARGGRDKVTFVPSAPFESFGTWAEQLLAESTGKDGKGLIPIDGEPPGPPEVYGADRVFVSLGLSETDPTLDALAEAGHPVVSLEVSKPAHLGALFYSFELATAAAGWRLGVNPFDEPNVSESKQNTAALIETFERDGVLPSAPPSAEEDGLQLFGAKAATVEDGLRRFLRRARAGDYVALQAFVPRDASTEAALRTIRTTVRDRLHVATTVGFGPRFLHSTGQLHKGGPNTGLFLQITTEHPEDVPIPGQSYTFGVLQAAQAAGDYDSLVRHKRRVVRVHLSDGVEQGLPALAGLIERSLA
jgi:glucose-6-phosphate isomerase